MAQLKTTQEILNAQLDSAANLNVSTKSDDAGLMRVSAIGLTGLNISNDDAGDFRTSSVQGDAGLLRVSAIGLTGLNISNDDAGDFRTSSIQGDAANLRSSSFVDSGSVSAKSSDAGTLLVSAKSGDGGTLRMSAVQDGAAALNISAKSNDGALLRTSAVQDGAAALNVSAKSNDGALLRVSSLQGYSFNHLITSGGNQLIKSGAGLLHTITVNAPRLSGVTLYNNTVSGGTTIGRISADAATGRTFIYDVIFGTGLVVSAGSSDVDLTISYL